MDRVHAARSRPLRGEAPGSPAVASLMARERLDTFTHARLWKNPCGFAARFNYLALRYNRPLYGWVESRFGLSRVEFMVLYSLSLMDGLTATEIASSSAFPKNTLSRAVNRLVRLGHISRRFSTEDRRQQVLNLAASGRAVIREALPRFVELEREMLSPLSPAEQDVLSDLLAKVVVAMFQNHPDDLIE